MFGVEFLLDCGQVLDCLVELQGVVSQVNGVDGVGGGIDDDWERIVGVVWQQVGDSGQDFDLVGCVGIVFGKDQVGEWWMWGKGIGYSGVFVMNCGEYSQILCVFGMFVFSVCVVLDRVWFYLVGGF